MRAFGSLMPVLLAAGFICISPTVLSADMLSEATARSIDEHALPAVAEFAAQTKVLDIAAKSDCTPAHVQPAYHTAFDAWMGLQHLNIGPIEDAGRLLTVAFWPDKKGTIARSLTRVIAAEDPIVTDAAAFTEMSIAVRGFFALEYLLFDAAFDGYAAEEYSCALVQAIAHDLARTGAEIEEGWTQKGGYADVLRSAGEPENERYYSTEEATQTLYTMLTTGLENTALARLGRPLGSFTKPRPRLAEAYRSERSLRNIILSIEAARDLAVALAPSHPEATLEAFDDLLEKAHALDDPILASVSDPAARLKVEIIQQRVQAVLGYIANDVGAPLGVSAGFNASDGD